MMKGKPFFFAYIWAGIIFVCCTVPSIGVEKVQKINKFFSLILSDYSMHFFSFGIFALLLCYGFYKAEKITVPFFKIILYSTGYGLFIELFQIPLPYRFFGFNDLVFDFLGAVAAAALFKLIVINRHVSKV